MPTANDFITRALRLLNVLDPTETPSPEDSELGLDVLNDWIDSLGVERQTIYYVTRTTQTLTASTASYTIGSGGTINIARPVWIQRAGLVLDTSASTVTEVPIRVLTDDEYALWPQKTLTSSLATAIYYDHNWSAGLGLIRPLPIPTVSTTQLVLYTPTALTEFADISSKAYTFPPAYRRALTYNLANELAIHYPSVQPDPRIAKYAVDSLAAVKRGNMRLSEVRTDRFWGRSGTLPQSRFLVGEA